LVEPEPEPTPTPTPKPDDDDDDDDDDSTVAVLATFMVIFLLGFIVSLGFFIKERRKNTSGRAYH